MTDGMIFESLYAANRYAEVVGMPKFPVRIIANGLYRHEFYEPMLADDASDFVFVGELRDLKGVDVLLEALAANQHIFPGRAVIVGSGPDEQKLKRLARKLNLGRRVSFAGPLPAHKRAPPRLLYHKQRGSSSGTVVPFAGAKRHCVRAYLAVHRATSRRLQNRFRPKGPSCAENRGNSEVLRSLRKVSLDFGGVSGKARAPLCGSGTTTP